MPNSTRELTLADQQRLIESLRTNPPFPEPCATAEVIETHISWVLLCGQRAYKIKKAVDLGFLDFSTLARRKQYCQEELRLNRRLAPNLYLGVLALNGDPRCPGLGDAAGAIEYVVEMARFEQSELLDRMLAEQRLMPLHIDRIADLVAAFHGAQGTAPPQGALGTPRAIHAPAQANFAALRHHLAAPRLLRQVDTLEAWSETTFERLREHFAARRKLGFVRECHGDMHLGNMAIHDDQIVIFDGIEFNPTLYWIDVMSEVAFLFMDLDDHGRRDLAWRFLNRYLNCTGDCEGTRVLRFYLCYRALVRAKVAAIKSAQAKSSPIDGPAAQYLDLALRYSQPPRPVLAIAHGLSGSGKSTVCAAVAERFGALHVRSDRERQRLFGRGGGSGVGAGSYAADATRQTYVRLRQCAAEALSARFSVIVDATFLDADRRRRFATLARQYDAEFRILHFHADPERLRQRVRDRHRRGTDLSEADLAVLEHQLRHYESLADAERTASVRIDTDRGSPEASAQTVIEQLADAQA